MKYIALLVCFYLFALTALPSVRAIKMQFVEKSESICQKNKSNSGEPSGCEKGKIIMNLSFNPVHFETTKLFCDGKKSLFIQITKEENISHKNVFISQYKSSIWQPPKISMAV